MIHNNIEFHNAAALEELDGLPGVCPVRYPREVRDRLNIRARLMGAHSASVELRWVTSSPIVRLALAAHDDQVTVHIYRGNFGHSDHVIPAGQTRVLSLAAPERLALVRPEFFHGGTFSPDVWRAQINGGVVGFLSLDVLGADCRPPLAEEKPRLRWLAYGSSITHSWAKGYPNQAARRLGVDVLNKGLSGACHCEQEAADFLAEENWDFATLELGVNMRGTFEPAEFEERAQYLVKRLRERKPHAPLALITHFLNWEHERVDPEASLVAGRQAAFDEILRRIAAATENTLLVEGREVLPEAEGLSCDLLHPVDYGHAMMGENLARLLGPVMEKLRAGI